MPNIPHVLLVGNYSNRTGYAWNNIYRLYDFIARTMIQEGLGVCVSFATIEPPITIIDQSVPIQSFVYDPINVKWSDVVRLVNNIKKYNIKYVYTTDSPSYHWTYPIMRLMGVKVIINHSRISVASPYPALPEAGIKRIIKSILTRIDFINVNKIYCVSNFVKNRMAQKNCIPETKLVRILNGINIDKFTCPPIQLNDTVRIFVGARATKHKGVHILFEAAHLLINKYRVTNFNIHYAGDGPDLDFLKSLVTKYSIEKYVYFLGELRGTQDYICTSDIIVVPSIWGDACPSSISEALAAGRPLITSRAGGIPEIVGDEANAILIEPGDAKMMAKKLDELIRNPELMKSIGIKAKLRAISALNENDYYRKVLSQIKSDFKLEN